MRPRRGTPPTASPQQPRRVAVARLSSHWFPATIVAHWPTTSEHDRLLMHFDDGMDEIITLPDDTVRLTGEAVVARCKCARCAVRPEAEDGGCTLPLPQPARPRRRS
mmetsp:Transcript_26802/g.87960  ORF Transcript_26802/g.87960 Transcript_26802/m.87960 type:complete len:107 (-) Transcript_26802:170-490(-)